MTELTRRQLRELERTGQITAAEATVPTEPITRPEVTQPAASSAVVITSRRQLREAASIPPAPDTSTNTTSDLRVSEEVKTTISSEPAPEVKPYATPEPLAPRRLSPVPPVGSRRALREVSATTAKPEPLVPIQPIEVEIPEDGFRGANYLGEPSTQSIMLEVAPEAIALPLDTGEVFTTGSIAILPEAPGPTTGGLDGQELDTAEDAVTGVLSIVDPVSAKTLIDERSPLGVVPEGVLRKGWWRPWVVGLVSLIMAIAAIFASFTIINALGG